MVFAALSFQNGTLVSSSAPTPSPGPIPYLVSNEEPRRKQNSMFIILGEFHQTIL